MDVPLPRISPAAAHDMDHDDPDGLPAGFGLALLRPKGRKIQPDRWPGACKDPAEQPAHADWRASGLWPISCTTSRVVPAPGVALAFIFHNHDAKVKSQQRLLAVVLTMHMDHDWQPAGHPVADR